MIQVNLPDQPPTIDLDDSLAPIDAVSVDEQTAINIVVQEFSAFESFRLQNHDPKWTAYDSLYLGRVPVKNWEGSRIQRSALPRRLSYDHVETAVPAVCNAIFGNSTDWFQVQADADTSPVEAQAVQARLQYLLDHSKTSVGSPGQSELRLAIRQALKYGNGGLEVKYDSDLQQATIEWCDIRDLYVDPTCPTPNLDEATAVVRRRLMTVQELENMRFDPATGGGDPRIKIPSLGWLQTAARTPFWAAGDQTKQSNQALRGITYTPGSSTYSPNPAGQRIEVLMYYTKYRIIWVLDRRWQMYSEPNPFGFIPFVFCPFVMDEGRFHGLSMIDAIASYQRYAEALQNNHLDEQNINLHPPRMITAPNLTVSQLSWRPGATWTVPMGQKASDMINVAQTSNITGGVMDFVQQLDMMAEKSSGVNSMSMGIPRPSNANRTSSGMSMQASGTSLRLSDFVRNIEDYLIVPMLDKLWRIEQLYNSDRQQVPVTAPDGAVRNVQPQLFKNARPKFRMVASTKMVTRERLMQVLPLIMNTVMSGPMLSALQQSGKTVDFDQLLKMVEDATGIGQLYQIVRPLNEQEIQALNQPTPQMQQEAQKAQQDAQVRLQMGQMKNQTDLQIAQIDSKSKSEAARASAQAAAQKAQVDMAKSAQDLKFKAQENQMKLGHMQQESEMKLFQAKNDMMVQLLQQAIDQRRWQQEVAQQQMAPPERKNIK